MWTLLFKASVMPVSLIGLTITAGIYGYTALAILLGTFAFLTTGFVILTFGAFYVFTQK
jgi:hypothetical protein